MPTRLSLDAMTAVYGHLEPSHLGRLECSHKTGRRNTLALRRAQERLMLPFVCFLFATRRLVALGLLSECTKRHFWFRESGFTPECHCRFELAEDVVGDDPSTAARSMLLQLRRSGAPHACPLRTRHVTNVVAEWEREQQGHYLWSKLDCIVARVSAGETDLREAGSQGVRSIWVRESLWRMYATYVPAVLRELGDKPEERAALNFVFRLASSLAATLGFPRVEEL